MKKLKVVTNKSKDPRKFRDKKLGRDVILQPGESTFTSSPPKPNSIFKVEDETNREKPKARAAIVGVKKIRKEDDSE